MTTDDKDTIAKILIYSECYTEDLEFYLLRHLESVVKKHRQAAIEEAAKVCEGLRYRGITEFCNGYNTHATQAANKIRELK